MLLLEFTTMLKLKNILQHNLIIYWILLAVLMATPGAHAGRVKSIFGSSSKPSTTAKPIPNVALHQATEVPSTTEPPVTMPPKSRDIKVGPCVWAIDRTCPDKDITFYLYTRRNPADRQYIHVDKTLESSNISQSFYDSRHPSKVLIHGYNADMFLHPLYMMKNEYLAKGDYNIFYVDWSKLAIGPCYVSAVHNIRHSGACVAQLVQRIMDMGSKDIHVIGFSLGGHLTNYIASSLDSFLLPRITALDPAMPLFVSSSKENKLDPSDAEYVDVIHTNAMIQGKLERCGHADFYINGGIVQPGCATDNPLNPFSCSHHRAIDYYLESIRTTKGFWGWSCSSYLSYLLGMCPQTNYLLEAGENAKKTTKGMFFVTTNEKSPFAQGKWTDLPTLGYKNPNKTMTSMLMKPSPPPSITIMQPQHRGDPLMRHIDQWGKLDYNFNNFNEYNPADGEVHHDPYDDNWTYFSDDPVEIANDVNANSVEEQDLGDYTFPGNFKHDHHGEGEIGGIEWEEYKMNATRGYIENSLFGVPILGNS
ncbi:pancreatic lipase-related protein 2 [Musca domestica]|uniref:Pancreatic lipase-related protein 2 n=1 Tax=Musca domestica TaxID=7370 RepID=A0ABM3V4L9_MUSDO|nr:pancreatic lipase-related protein 2 [Musca domestica]